MCASSGITLRLPLPVFFQAFGQSLSSSDLDKLSTYRKWIFMFRIRIFHFRLPVFIFRCRVFMVKHQVLEAKHRVFETLGSLKPDGFTLLR